MKKKQFLNRLQGEIAKRGIIDVLRNGVKVYPANLIMFYLTPTENNAKASNVRANEASGHIEQVLGSVAFQIPHSEEVFTQVLEGNLFTELSMKDSRGFRKSIEAITKEVFGC